MNESIGDGMYKCPKCGEFNDDNWPLTVDGTIGGCQMCWETESSEQWWAAVDALPDIPGRWSMTSWQVEDAIYCGVLRKQKHGIMDVSDVWPEIYEEIENFESLRSMNVC